MKLKVTLLFETPPDSPLTDEDFRKHFQRLYIDCVSEVEDRDGNAHEVEAYAVITAVS